MSLEEGTRLPLDPIIEQTNYDGANCPRPSWLPISRRACEFGPSHFDEAMINLIRNPNLLSSWLVRADVLYEQSGEAHGTGDRPPVFAHQPQLPPMAGLQCRRVFVRRLIPRNIKRDRPLVQTCPFYGDTRDGRADADESAGSDASCERSLVLYLPHVSSESALPFYHPSVRGVGFLHEWNPRDGRGLGKGFISVHYRLFDDTAPDLLTERLERTALNLLAVVHKLGQGHLRGYVKRVRHDALVPRSAFQDRCASLKNRHARTLVQGWVETTDPMKHVFEDLCIAAFLIELWTGMYPDIDGRTSFPGFVDIGCGNGLLVSILNKEGFRGWGFDARARKSWKVFNSQSDGGTATLQQLVLLPAMARDASDSEQSLEATEVDIHDGAFPEGTFMISNHGDELTPWTPILAAASNCPFMAIPCCSHDLRGAKFRAPPPKNKDKPKTAYSSLVSWVSDIAADCGWEVETEILRIPSTRNTAVLGRRRKAGWRNGTNWQEVINKYGGAGAYRENAMGLAKMPRSSSPMPLHQRA